MRRFSAFAALLAFANLSFVQAGGSCPVSDNRAHGGEVVATGHSEHAGHAMPTPSNEDVLDQAPSGDATHPACLMMGPCALSIDVSHMVVLAVFDLHDDGVPGGSDLLPPSPTDSPDIPPPRA